MYFLKTFAQNSKYGKALKGQDCQVTDPNDVEHLISGLVSSSGKQGSPFHRSNIKTEKHALCQGLVSDNAESEHDIVSFLFYFVFLPTACLGRMSRVCRMNWGKIFSNSRTVNFGKTSSLTPTIGKKFYFRIS